MSLAAVASKLNTLISIPQLQSRITRINITGGAGGVTDLTRRVSSNDELANTSNNTGIWGWLKGLGQATIKFGGWLLNGIVNGLSFTFSAAWGWFTGKALQLYSFNWNISDEDIDKLVESSKIAVASYLGDFAGQVAGWTVCGAVPIAAIAVFNQKLGMHLFARFGPEALDELGGEFSALIQAIVNMSARNALFTAYKNTRRWIKGFFADKNSPQSQLAQKIFKNIDFNGVMKAWGDEDSPPWSFRQWVEEKIESIEDPVTQAFWEEFHDSAIDACIEAGYVVAGGLDDWVAEKKAEETRQKNATKTFEITPNREADQEKIIITGDPSTVRQNAPLVMSVHSLLDNRDVGQIVGESVREAVRTPPISLQLTIQLSSAKMPPLIDANGKQAKRVQITVPNLDRVKLDWEKIKRAAGGGNGYSWGRYKGLARLDTGHSLTVWAASEAEAKDRLYALIELSESKIQGITITELTNEGTRQTLQALRHDPTLIYPVFVTIINQQQILNQDSGLATLSGTYKHKRYRVPLYTDTKPDDWDDIIQDLLRIPGANNP